jgi:predicted ATPase
VPSRNHRSAQLAVQAVPNKSPCRRHTNFFFIGAFRDDEVDPSSILSWVGKPSETGLDVVNILVGPLDSVSVNQMVADLTERRIEQTKGLSELVGRKTARNAYFLVQYMEALERQGLLVQFQVESLGVGS